MALGNRFVIGRYGDSMTEIMTPSPTSDPFLDSAWSLRAELRFDSRNEGSGTHVIIEDPVRSKFYQVGADEYRLIASLDGHRTLREIVGVLNQSLPTESHYREETARAVCQWLMGSNLLVAPTVDHARRLNQQATSMRKAKLMGVMNPISCKFKLFNPNTMLTVALRYANWLFSKWFAIIWCMSGLYAFAQIGTHWEKMGAASAGILSGHGWLWLMLTWVGLKAIHEFAHGIACRRYGGEVPEAGVLLLLFTPMAYVNVTSMWRFSNPWQRIVVAAAGMYIELFISFWAIILWSRTNGMVADLAFNIFIMSSVTTLLFNANPLMRFDGYFLLSDLLGIANLYPKGTKWFGNRAKHLLLGTPLAPSICPPSELRRVAIYGCLAFFWKISISISLIIGAGVLFHGAGILLSGLGIALWFGIPIFNQFKAIFGPNATTPPYWPRIATSSVCLTLMGIGLFSIFKAPVTKSAPAIVQFSDETLLRAEASGFVNAVLVADGQKVRKGQPLLTLTNPELLNEVAALERLAKEAEIQARIHRQAKELALVISQQRKQEELEQQLAEKQAESAHLQVIAPFDGFVFERNLENRIGSFVERGDVLLTVARQQSKEVVVSIDQQDLDSIKGNMGQRLKVVFPGLPVFESTLAQINPRASQMPTHPSLCANAGGPLSVQPMKQPEEQEDDGFELLSPRFNAVLQLDREASGRLYSGQRGRAFFATVDQPLGSYLYFAAYQWLEKKIELATQAAAF